MMKRFAKMVAVLTGVLLFAAAVTSCGSADGSITVISREDGSGTRSAFVELVGVVDENGNDITAKTAQTTNSTGVMLTSVAGNKSAIGYVSLGSLSAEVKALAINGVAATAENVKNGTYQIARPFNLVYKEGSLSELAQDFIAYVMSAEGQQIIADNGYIAADGAAAPYTASGVTGTLTLAGSTSVSPVMEKIKDAYKKINTGVTIHVEQSGSGAGIKGATDGTCDIGMSSRDLKTDEAATLVCKTIARDGIAVIVHKDNAVSELTTEQIKEIFMGNLKNWSELG